MVRNADWFIRTDEGQELGPLTEAQLRDGIKTYLPEGLFVRQGTSAWVPAAVLIQRLRELDLSGIYLRSGKKQYGPFVEQRAKELLGASRSKFDAYRVGMNSDWQEIPTDFVRLSPPPLPMMTPPPLPGNRPPPLPHLGASRELNLHVHEAGMPVRRSRNRGLQSTLGWMAILICGCVPLCFIWESVLVSRYDLPSIAFLWKALSRETNSKNGPTGEASNSHSDAIDSYERELKSLVERWSVPNSIHDLSSQVLDTDFKLFELRLMLCKQEQLEAIRVDRMAMACTDLISAARELIQAVNAETINRGINTLYTTPSSPGYVDEDASREVAALVGANPDEQISNTSEAILPVVNRLLGRADAWLSAEKSKLDRKQKELQEYPKLPDKINFRDSLGKLYTTREERDQAIRNEVLSGKYDNSNGNQSKAVYQSYIQTNLAKAWERDRIDVHELEIKKSENARLEKELAKVVDRIATRFYQASRARQALESCIQRVEEFELTMRETRDELNAQLQMHANRISSTIGSFKTVIQTIEIPRSIAALGGKVPVKPERPVRKEHNGVFIRDLTFRVEGDCYFTGNKMIRIPDTLREYFVSETGAVNHSPNEVLVSGTFAYKGNLATPFQGTRPLEEYGVPTEFVAYLAEEKVYATAMQSYNVLRGAFDRAEELFREKSAAAIALVDAFGSNSADTPSANLAIAQNVIEQAANLRELSPPNFKISKDDQAIVASSLAHLSTWSFAIPQATTSEINESTDEQAAMPTDVKQATTENSAHQQGKNYLRNGDFELDGKPMGSPTGWTTWSPKNDPSADSTAWDGQSHCLNHFHSKPYVIYTGQHVEVPNGHYKLTMKVRSSGGQNTACAIVKFSNGTEKRSSKFRKSNGWQLVEIDNIQVTSGKCEVGIISSAAATQWVNVDDIKLEKK